MTSIVTVFFAALPLFIVGLLLIGLLWSATRTMPVAWLSAVVIGAVVWGMPASWIIAASISGVLTAFQILFIVFGALVLLYTMLRAGAFSTLNRSFTTVSDDRRVQIVLVAFFLSAFIEGAAGFGTPAAVVAPLLLGLGFPALAAVVAALIGHAIAVTYGAVGTPIIVGIREPLENVGYINQVLAGNDQTATEFAINVAAWAATYHLLIGFMMPLFAVGIVVYFFTPQGSRSMEPIIEVVPLCLFAGFAFVIPYWITAQVSAELPALVGSMVGAAVVIAALRAGYFQPSTEWDFPPLEEWPSHWLGSIQPEDVESVLTEDREMSLLKAWFPYIFLIGCLLLTRSIDPMSSLLQGETVILLGTPLSLQIASVATVAGEFTIGILLFEWTQIAGTTIGNSINLLYVPGMWLLASAVIAVPLYRLPTEAVSAIWKEAAVKLVTPLIALSFVLAMVQVMLQSGSHTPGLDSMIVVLAVVTADVLGPAYPLVAPLIGALGAALVGSNTVSNITFGPLQFFAADSLGISRELTVGAQAVGGAVGNLVAIHNVVAALATVGLVGEEGRVIRLTLIPLIYYVVCAGIVSVILTYLMFPTTF